MLWKITRNSYEKLEDTVQEQRDKLERLQSEYKNTALEMGSTSDEAKDLKEQIKYYPVKSMRMKAK